MKNIYLTLVLVLGLSTTQSWAPPPGKGGATGGAEAAPDISKCKIEPELQTRIEVKDKKGNIHQLCTGLSVCGESVVPVSCKVSNREPCPMAIKCITFNPEDINLSEPIKLLDDDIRFDRFGDPQERRMDYMALMEKWNRCIKTKTIQGGEVPGDPQWIKVTKKDSRGILLPEAGSLIGTCQRSGADWTPIPVCRAKHDGNFLIGQMISGKCIFGYNKLKVEANEFETLVGTSKLAWKENVIGNWGGLFSFGVVINFDSTVPFYFRTFPVARPDITVRKEGYFSGRELKDGKQIGICRANFYEGSEKGTRRWNFLRGKGKGLFVGWFPEKEGICRLEYNNLEVQWGHEFDILYANP